MIAESIKTLKIKVNWLCPKLYIIYKLIDKFVNE